MNVKAFIAYLDHLETYQSIILWAIVFGLIIAFVGGFLVYVLREVSTKERLKFKTKSGYEFSFSSTLSGSLVSLAGGFIVCVGLISIVFVFPKIDGDGWKTNVSLSLKKMIEAVQTGQAELVTLSDQNGLLKTEGLIIKEDLANRLKGAGHTTYIMPHSSLSEDVKGKISHEDDLYFYPLESYDIEEKQLEQLLNEASSARKPSVNLKVKDKKK